MSGNSGKKSRGRGAVARYAGYGAVIALLAAVVIYSQAGSVSWIAIGAGAALAVAAVVMRGR